MLAKSDQISARVNTGLATLILALALLLVVFVGLGDAYRNFPNFITDKLNAQGQIVKTNIETFLSSGLPLEQFAGFSRLAKPLDETDSDIARISIVDSQDKIVFDLVDRDSKSLLADPNATNILQSNGGSPFLRSSLQSNDSVYKLLENERFYQVVLPVKSKFEQVGTLQILMPKERINRHVNTYFFYVAIVSLLALGIFAAIAFISYRRLCAPGSQNLTTKSIDITYGVAYIVVALAVVAALTFLYSEGIQAKTQAVTLSLGSRLNAPIELGLKLLDFSGIEKTFEEYQKLNPEISSIVLRSGDKTEIATAVRDKSFRNTDDFSNFAYEVQLKSQQDSELVLQAILVKTPKDFLYIRIWRSVKNFLALFIASAFLSNLFLNLLRFFTARPKENTDAYQVFQLKRIEPYYFLGSFVDGLSISFLPQYLSTLASSSHVDQSLVPTLFTFYFLGWALAMIPAANIINHRGIKPVVIWVGVLNVIVAILMAFVDNFYAMAFIRTIAGVGQGVLTVAVQSYILEVTSAKRKTQGNNMMVFDFFSARLSSTAIGALLSVYAGIQGVFIIGIVISLLAIAYAMKFVPEVTVRDRLSEQKLELSWLDPATGEEKKQICQLPIVIGRESARMPNRIKEKPTTKLKLSNKQISSFHASIVLDAQLGEQKFVITDRGSKDGVFVNGARQTNQIITEGDVIKIGPYSISVAFAADTEGSVVPEIAEADTELQVSKTSRTFSSNFADTFKDLEFVKAILFVGIPYRAVFTGVTVFAMPLLLAQQGYLAEDIGQIMMFYAAGVLISSSFISRLVDRIGHTDRVLFLGNILSGVGLFLIGLLSWLKVWQGAFSFLSVICEIVGITILGFGHGFINAPSLTYITQTQVANKIGQTRVGSLYRLIERSGQIIGPILVGQLLVFSNGSSLAISWFGIAVIFLGVIFFLRLDFSNPAAT
jgi:MFS family permease